MVVWPPGAIVPQVMDEMGVVKPASLNVDTPIVLMGVCVGVGVGVDGGGVCVGWIDPVVDKVWLVVSSPVVSAVSNMPVMTIAIIAPEPIFLNDI